MFSVDFIIIKDAEFNGDNKNGVQIQTTPKGWGAGQKNKLKKIVITLDFDIIEDAELNGDVLN